MIVTYDKAEIKKAWEAQMEASLTDEIVDSIIDLIEQTRHEVAKGRSKEVMTIAEAVEIVSSI